MTRFWELLFFWKQKIVLSLDFWKTLFLLQKPLFSRKNIDFIAGQHVKCLAEKNSDGIRKGWNDEIASFDSIL